MIGASSERGDFTKIGEEFRTDGRKFPFSLGFGSGGTGVARFLHPPQQFRESPEGGQRRDRTAGSVRARARGVEGKGNRQ